MLSALDIDPPPFTPPAPAAPATSPADQSWGDLGKTLAGDVVRDLVQVFAPKVTAAFYSPPTAAQIAQQQAAAAAAAKAEQQRNLMIFGGIAAVVVVGALVLRK